MVIRIAGIVKESVVDGPGFRYVVFTQGCYHNCKGCHNQHTHDIKGGYDKAIEEILKEFDSNPLLSGLTLSGGEPMLQAEKLIGLAKEIKDRGRNVIVYTGYTLEELLELGDLNTLNLLHCIDTLIDGKYIEEEHDYRVKFRGSKNQRAIDMDIYWSTGKITEVEFN